MKPKRLSLSKRLSQIMSKNKFFLACKEGDTETLWNLRTKGLSIANIVAHKKSTSHHLKLARHSPETIELLLEWENNVDFRLIWAVKKRFFEVIKACVKLGYTLRSSLLVELINNNNIEIVKALGKLQLNDINGVYVSCDEMINTLLKSITNLRTTNPIWTKIFALDYDYSSLIRCIKNERNNRAILALFPITKQAKIPIELLRLLKVLLIK